MTEIDLKEVGISYNEVQDGEEPAHDAEHGDLVRHDEDLLKRLRELVRRPHGVQRVELVVEAFHDVPASVTSILMNIAREEGGETHRRGR